jgi:cytochrome c-type biogenesis protein CcmH/NrfF
MTLADLGFAVIAAAVTVYQVWVSWMVLRYSAYSRAQRIAQLLLVWLVPVIGALAVHLVIYGFTVRARRRDDHFLPEDNAMS